MLLLRLVKMFTSMLSFGTESMMSGSIFAALNSDATSAATIPKTSKNIPKIFLKHINKQLID